MFKRLRKGIGGSRLLFSGDKWKNAFIFQIDTRNISSGSSTDTQFKCPFVPGGDYDCQVYWDDGSSNHITSWNQAETLHDYGVGNSGVKTIRITGTIVGFKFNDGGDCLKIIEIPRCGCLRLPDANRIFAGCGNLIFAPVDTLYLHNVSFQNGLFYGIKEFNYPIYKLNDNDGFSGTNLFSGINTFNQSISDLDTSRFSSFAYMFAYSPLFDQPLASLIIANVETMVGMLDGAILSVANFSATLIGWQAQSHKKNVSVSFGNSKIVEGSAADDALISLVVDDGWTIIFGGYV
jgi:hypothetical protein